MVWDRDVLVRIGGFDAGLGPTGGKFSMGEDTELCLRLRARVPGATIWYSPELKVLHSVTERRFSVGGALARGYKEGLGWVAASPPQGTRAWIVEFLRRCGIAVVLIVASLVGFQWLYRPRNWCFENGRRIFVQVGNLVGLVRAVARRKG
jgi:GT2 family glycosyltransferase